MPVLFWFAGKATMKLKWKRMVCAVFAAAVLAGAALLLHPDGNSIRECPENPKNGIWYSISPEGAVCSDGSVWQGRIRFGRENKLLLYFLGGGVSLDEYSAARSYSAVGGGAFYFDRDDGVTDRRITGGICSAGQENPFRNWTVAVFPYTTADFHAGTGDAAYIAMDGGEAALRHRGYANFSLMLEKILPLAGNPEALMIAGYSAGGFGAAMLADEIIGRFENVQNVTVAVDAALLLHQNWRGIARDRWHAPEEILERIRTDNLTLDHLRSLSRAHGNRVKILFSSSVRDGALAMYQNYMDGGSYEATEEYGEIYRRNLQDMVDELLAEIPGAGVFIWDGLPYSDEAGSALTQHTVMYTDDFFRPLGDGVSLAQWMAAASEGMVESHGLSLLKDS